tara:strand:- start:13106 stop:13927 length:822 start_codon:yes stop_codon:yes gene_type:complete
MDCVEELIIHQDAVEIIAFDNDIMYSVDANGNIQVLKDYKPLYSLLNDTSNVSIAFGDGLTFESAFESVKIWKKDKLINTLVTTDYISSIVYADGLLYIGYAKGDIEVLKYHEQIALLKGHEDYVRCLVYGDGLLYSADDSGIIKVWKDFECISTIKAHGAGIINLVYGDKMLHSHGDDGLIKSYKGNECVAIIEKEQDEVNSIAYRDGMLYCAGEALDGIEVWKNGTYITKLEDDKPVKCLACNGGMLYSGHSDGTIKAWKEVGLLTKAALK